MPTKRAVTRKTGTAGGARGAAQTFPVVGLGASAGGLEAFTQFLRALPVKTGMAFVLVQHLEARHESMLTKLLARETAMPVTEVRRKTAVEPNHVYVIPANADLSLADGALEVIRRKAMAGHHLPIDHFFRTLAETQGPRAVGVILSGTASDGTLGLKAIKVAGGITMAQEPSSAKFGGMPQSAILAGCVDLVLPPEGIAREMGRLTRHPYVRLSTGAGSEQIYPSREDEWTKIFRVLKSVTGVDFTFYKKSTLSRRVGRRMALHKMERLGEYLKYLDGNREEVEALYQDILIHVTSFFRDPDVFRALRNKILPKLVAQKPAGEAMRIWVPGCSTGEEVYSVAICLMEALGERAKGTPIQIFGSDVSEQAIERARTGVYPKEALAEVSKERVRRFFTRADGQYQIVSTIRDLCLFARHDLTKDPPFSRLDLISCRNVLIYLEPVLQRRVVTSLHYGLREKGVLLLGKSETLGGFPGLFKLADQKNKFFEKRGEAGVSYELAPAARERQPAAEKQHGAEAAGFDLEKEADRIIWERSHHAGLVVNDALEILHFRGDTSPYVRPAPGKANLHLMKMLREELVMELRTLLAQARKTRRSVRKDGVRVKRNGGTYGVNIEIRPLPARRTGERYFLILFEETARAATAEPAGRVEKGRRKGAAEGELAELRSELTRTRDYLQAIIQEQETTNEELKAANEEAQSSMEELQSTNEELETAKEELQSTNEELVTLNEQLQNRNAELGRLSDDLTNVLAGVNIPIVMLDAEHRIRRFTPSAEALLELVPGDIGRPIRNLRLELNVPDLDKLISGVMDRLREEWRDVQSKDGHWYSMRIVPFLTKERKVEGVLMVLVDIQDAKESHNRLEKEQKLLNSIVDAARGLLVMILDGEGRIVQFNRACQETSGYTAEEVKGRKLWDALAAPEARAEVRRGFEKALEDGTVHGESHWLTREGRHKLIAWTNTVCANEEGGVDYVIRTGVDVTEREQAQEQARDSDSVVQALLEAAPAAFLAHDGQGRILMMNAAAEAMFGYSRDELAGKPLEMLVPERFRARHSEQAAKFFLRPGRRPMGSGRDFFGLRRDGAEFPVDIGLSYFETRSGRLAITFITDVTERKKGEAALQSLTARLISVQEAGNRELARELHDDLSQKLAALGMEVSMLPQSPAGAGGKLEERVKEVGARVSALAGAMHAMSRRLHPAVLDELGLEAALREECAGFSAQTGIPAEFESEGVPEKAGEEIALCLYRVTQEGLRNIAKHAGAGSAKVSLRGGKDGLRLRIDDDGTGFNPAEVKGKGGLGLVSVEERVRLVEGRLEIRSNPGDGTTVEVFVPRRRG